VLGRDWLRVSTNDHRVRRVLEHIEVRSVVLVDDIALSLPRVVASQAVLIVFIFISLGIARFIGFRGLPLAVFPLSMVVRAITSLSSL